SRDTAVISGNDIAQVFRIEPCAEGRGLDQVDEHDGQQPPLGQHSGGRRGGRCGGRPDSGATAAANPPVGRVLPPPSTALPRHRRSTLAAGSSALQDGGAATRADHTIPPFRTADELFVVTKA